MIIKCGYEGCNQTISGPDVSPDATFTCKNHTPPAEKTASFQPYQFDKELNSGNNIVGVGFQIVDIEERANPDVPEWTKSDEKIRELIKRSFPKFETNDVQRLRASRWARIIYLHFRMAYSMSQIADEMTLSIDDVKNILNRIRRVAAGRRANNTGKRGS